MSEGRLPRGRRQALLSGAQWQDQSQRAQTETREPTSEHQGTLFHCEGDRVLARAAQKGVAVSNLGDIQKPPGHGPGQAALGGPAWAGVWTGWPPEVSPQPFCGYVTLYCSGAWPACLAVAGSYARPGAAAHGGYIPSVAVVACVAVWWACGACLLCCATGRGSHTVLDEATSHKCGINWFIIRRNEYCKRGRKP